jgi:hypothetical protein
MKHREKALKKKAIYPGETEVNRGTRQVSPVPETNIMAKQYKRPVANLMLNAFLKKD